MLLDNKTQGKVGDVLAESIEKDARLSMLSSLFSIYGYEALQRELGKVAAVRILLPMGTASSGIDAPLSPRAWTITTPDLSYHAGPVICPWFT